MFSISHFLIISTSHVRNSLLDLFLIFSPFLNISLCQFVIIEFSRFSFSYCHSSISNVAFSHFLILSYYHIFSYFVIHVQCIHIYFLILFFIFSSCPHMFFRNFFHLIIFLFILTFFRFFHFLSFAISHVHIFSFSYFSIFSFSHFHIFSF